MASATSGVSVVTSGTGRNKRKDYYKTDVTTLGDGSVKRETYRTDANGNNAVKVQEVVADKDGNITSDVTTSNATASEKRALSNSDSQLRQSIRTQTKEAGDVVQKNEADAAAGRTTDVGKDNLDVLAGGSGNDANNGQPDNASQPAAELDGDTVEGSDNSRASYGDIVFPNEVRGGAQGLIKFTMLKYNPKGKGSPIGTVILAAPGGLADNNTIDWAGQRMNAVQQELANIALSTVDNGAEGFKDSSRAAIDKVIAERGGVSKALKTALIGNALGVDQQLFTRETGAIINPNLELLFSGPALRQFQFQFKLSARNESERDQIAGILKFFKQGSAVQRSKANLFLKSPNTFKIEYWHKGGLNQYINRIKECALQSVSVNYTPEGTYAIHPDGSMISYELSLAFSELEPVFEDDEEFNHPIGL